MEYSAHIKQIIEQLTPLRQDPAFEETFVQHTQDLSNADRFQIKMEVNRRNKPCQRPIDLRQRYKSECQLFEHNNIAHYMPEKAIDAYKSLLELYAGAYTFAIYEHILARFKVKPKSEQFESKTQQSEVERTLQMPVEFGQRLIRNEERMNYTTQVKLKSGKRIVDAITRDISPSGLRIKIKSVQHFDSDIPLLVSFSHWQQQFVDQICEAKYKICWQKTEKETTILGLATLDDDVSQSFGKFVEKYVRSYKRKYRLDACNTLQSARNILFEQCYFYTHSALPLFIAQKGMEVHIPYVCKQQSNAHVLDYWQDENGICQLRELLSGRRLSHLLNQLTPVKNEYLFCFTHVQHGKKHYFSATYDELERFELTDLFLGFGAQKPGWRVFKVQLQEIDLNNAWRAVSIPESAGEEIKKHNQPIGASVQQRLSQISHFALLLDVTNSVAKNSYLNHEVEVKHLDRLMSFKQEKLEATQTQAIRYEILGKRKELRMRYDTLVKLECAGAHCVAKTVNVSPSGLQIRVDKWFDFEKGSKVKLSFPLLEGSVKGGIGAQAYQVMATNPQYKVLGLRIISPVGKVSGVFSRLIHNQHLDNKKAGQDIEGLELALRNLIVMSTSQCCGFLLKPNKDLYCILAQSATANRLSALLDKAHQFHQNAFEAFLLERFKLDEKAQNQLHAELLLVCNEHQVEPVAWLEQEVSEPERQKRLQQEYKRGCIWVIRLESHAAIQPDYKSIELELTYLNSFQPAAAQQLERYIETVQTCFTLTDVTREAMIRYNFDSATIAKNHQQQNEFVFDVLD
ncbi:PilZ domain-containing protein [Catenovulum sediminis]|uniref:PilZ domain-containing protein n=1 Tax=Catenovulum sediminis TaxID=1740262 RepID=A0ABV1RCC8_9ALTE